MKAYVIIVERKDGQPSYDEDIFCTFQDPDDSDMEVQISFNKAHVESQAKIYEELDNSAYKYRMVEVYVNT